jgi:hypothetical protein
MFLNIKPLSTDKKNSASRNFTLQTLQQCVCARARHFHVLTLPASAITKLGGFALLQYYSTYSMTQRQLKTSYTCDMV